MLPTGRNREKSRMKPEETESEGGGDENRWRLMKRQKRRDMEETEGKGFRHMKGEMERDLLPCLPAVWFPITKWRSPSNSELPVSISNTRLGCRKRSEALSPLLLWGRGCQQGLEWSQADLWAWTL